VDLGLSRHFVNTEPFVTELVERAAKRTQTEKKVKEEAAAKAAARREKVGAAAKTGDGSGPEEGEAQ
jgi:hypothetical protein